MFNNIYQGRKVLITGHTGFKGAWLAAWLIRLGADVAGFSDQIPNKTFHSLGIGLIDKIHHFKGDLGNRVEIEKTMSEFEPEIIFHLAAQDNIDQAYLNPLYTFESNVSGTLHILEAVRQCQSVKVIICATGDRCYRGRDWIYAYREDDHLGGKDPHNASKACAEHIAQAYFESFFKNKVACATVRDGNIMGGGDWATHRFIPNCIRAWIDNKALSLDNSTIIYPWLYVLEPLSGYLCLGSKLFQAGQEFPNLAGLTDLAHITSITGQAYNFGSTGHESHSIAQVVKLLSLHLPNFKSPIIENNKPTESAVFKLCTDKALTKLQWRAVLDFEETIRYTVEWYRAFYANDGKNMFSYTMGQISSYTNAAHNRGLLWAN